MLLVELVPQGVMVVELFQQELSLVPNSFRDGQLLFVFLQNLLSRRVVVGALARDTGLYYLELGFESTKWLLTFQTLIYLRFKKVRNTEQLSQHPQPK